MNATNSGFVKSADRTLAILDLLTQHRDGLTLVEIQTALQLPKSSAYLLLVTMANRGFLEQDPDTRRFRVGIRLWQAGQSYVAVSDLERVALPYMEALRDELNETVQLATLDGTDNVYIAKVDPDQQLRLASRVGARLPAYATGIGKALLSQLDDDELRARFAEIPFVQYTPRTINSLDALLVDLRRVRAAGYATDNSEYTPGVFCVATAVPRPRGLAGAAVSVSIPEVRKTSSLIKRAISGVRVTAQELSQRIGGQESQRA